MKASLLGTLLLAVSLLSSASDDIAAIEKTLNNYIQGTSFNNREQIKSAFSDEAYLLLEKEKKPIWQVHINDYISWFKKENAGKANGRIGEILSIDADQNIATAKVEILIPDSQLRFVDMFLLKKLSNGWKIIAKSAVKKNANNSGERILFIVSNAHFHGTSKLRAGVSFGELVGAYDTFKKEGYTVDFVSPEGGAIPLSYINTSDPLHKKYAYDKDFMHALGNTKSPDEITASKFRAVHYIGGSNAMYGVAENRALQKISMEIYEKHQGIISSVCHGTAGIVNLKTKDGIYLVNGKRISGYPDSYESQDKAYFKEFPFLIQQTIEQRGGEFLFSPRSTPHVEVDGRIVTGQNHLSSALVAEKMIELLKRS